MDRLKVDWKRNLKLSLERNLKAILETHDRHQLLITACAKAFADTSLSEKTGYQFYFVEPLIEKSSEKKDNCIFDVVIYNPSDCSAIFIECKSSSKNSCGSVKQIEKAKQLVLDNVDYLTKKIGLTLDPSKIEFVECVFFEDSYEIAHKIASQDSQTKENAEKLPTEIKVWEYFQGTQEIGLCKGHQHRDPQLTAMLSNRYGNEDLRNQFEVPYYLNLHPFYIIINILLGCCYIENLNNDSITDKKKISRNQIFKHLLENAYFGLNPTEIKVTLKKLTERIIKFGIDCDLFEEIDPDHIRIKCQGTKLKSVKENLTKKYFENWTDCKSEERAKIQALDDIKTMIAKSHPTLDDFGLG